MYLVTLNKYQSFHNTQYKILYDMVKTTLTTNCVKNQKVREANTMFKMNMY